MTPNTLITVAEAREQCRAWRRSEQTVSLVPTMGALHEGHLSLVRKAKDESDRVVVSIFVNPTQFGPSEDFAKYPRSLLKDMAVLKDLGVDAIFAPTANEVYPTEFQTWVSNDGMSDILCGAKRKGHFRGVCTVVLKLLNIVQPDVAVFGKKDYQQLKVLQKMVDDLNVPTRIIGCETFREPDGLAMSSRNRYLSENDRSVAQKLSSALTEVQQVFHGGERQTPELVERFHTVLRAENQIEIEYAELRTQNKLSLIEGRCEEPAVFLAAIHLAGVRLIDNIELE